jgi:hypothetical protein
MGKIYAAVTADIVGSRQLPEFRKARDKKLRPISKRHMSEELLLSDYAITAWDEFQAILKDVEYIPRIVLDLRRLFHPMELWIAVGIGEVSEPHKKPVNVYSGGPAFERAREAAEDLKGKGAKFPMLTRIRSGNQVFDAVANTLYGLHDSLIAPVTHKQWETINTYMESQNQEAAARKLHLDVSTISRNLKRGHYWEMQETRKTMELLTKTYF